MCICEPKKKLKRNYSAMDPETETIPASQSQEMEATSDNAAASSSNIDMASSSLVVPSHYSKDVPDLNATPGQCGLYNLGNTCFMNAGLQSLLSTTPLLKYFLEHLSSGESHVDNMTTNFQQMVLKVWSGNYSIVYPRDFKNALGLFHVQFQDYRQHDCQEFLALFLDTMHQQLKNREESTKNNLQPIAIEIGKEKECQLNNSMNAKAEEENVPNLNNSTKSMTEEVTSESGSHTVSSQEDSAKVSYVIQSELPSLLKSVVRTDSGSDLVEMQQEANELEPILNNASNLKQRIPKIEEFYAKDTKTLNTNVVSTNFDAEDLATDSEKFPKPELNNHSDNELSLHVPVEAVAMTTVKEDGSRKGIKNTNIQAEKCNKVQKMNEIDRDSDNIIKKMKFECAEKNFQYQALSKINKDFDITEQNLHLASYGVEGVNLIKDLGILGSLDKEMCDDIMRRTHLLLEEKTAKLSSTQIETAKMESEECSESLEKWKSKNMKSKKSQLPEGCSKKFKYEAKHEGSPADSTLSTDNETEDDRDYSVDRAGDTADMERDEEALVEAEEEAADRAWENYIQDNHSIIVSTFQGQFKSTVVCSECSHVSVTFEPFMYLSVPLPHASDRQLCVLYVPMGGIPTRYLLTMLKSDKTSKVKQELKNMIGGSVSDIVLAEALDHHISRVLEDNVMLQYINDSTRTVYAFEMPPIPPVCEDQPDSPKITDYSAVQASTGVGDVFSTMGTFTKTDVGDINMFMQPASETLSSENFCDTSENAQVKDQSYSIETWDTSCNDVFKNTKNTSEWTQSDSDDLRRSLNEVMVDVSGTDIWSGHLSAGQTSPVQTSDWLDNGTVIDLTGVDQGGWTQNVQMEDPLSKKNENASSGTTWGTEVPKPEPVSTVVADKWKSCAICLEELEDSELLCHTMCGGTFCHSCLEMSIKHYGEESYLCPVCSNAAVLTEDFCPLGSDSSSPQNLRLLVVPVTLRDESGCTSKLIGHPKLVYLYSSMSGTQVYENVLNMFPDVKNSTIVMTDGQGLKCSRCQYSEQCQGCPISHDTQVNLRPGDCLAICLNGMSESKITELDSFMDDESMEYLRPETPLSIFDCLEAFTDSEVLDEHNPWFCPRCQRNQCAKKTITVWQYPDTLIVHLKRFVYHDLSSTKVDAEVIFPLEELNLSQYVSGPDAGCLTYDLYSIVCHFGGANAGHYTTFSKHPLDGEWYYYNDESVTKQIPRKEDYKNAYILFYSRQGSDVKFDPSNIYLKMNDTQTVMDQQVQLSETLNNRTLQAAIPSSSPQCLVYGPLNIDQLPHTSDCDEKRDNSQENMDQSAD